MSSSSYGMVQGTFAGVIVHSTGNPPLVLFGLQNFIVCKLFGSYFSFGSYIDHNTR